nr:hypothetical protein [Acinetobacter oleivorans]
MLPISKFNLLINKTQPTQLVMDIKVGAKDLSGNKIIQVHAKHNEFAIYEIETSDINNKLRVLIDGYTNASEREIQDRFNKVKQKYIEANGLLSNTPKFEMLKRRIAHTLSTCLNSSHVDGQLEFTKLIETIQKEHQILVIHRAIYILPALIFVLMSGLFTFFFLGDFKKDLSTINTDHYLACMLLAVSSGACISILMNTTKLNFEEYSLKKYYFMLGFERVLFSIVAGTAAMIFIQAGLLFPSFTTTSISGTMVVILLAGFSESLIPSVLSKIETKDKLIS